MGTYLRLLHGKICASGGRFFHMAPARKQFLGSSIDRPRSPGRRRGGRPVYPLRLVCHLRPRDKELRWVRQRKVMGLSGVLSEAKIPASSMGYGANLLAWAQREMYTREMVA